MLNRLLISFSDPVVRLHRVDSTRTSVDVLSKQSNNTLKTKTSHDRNSKRRKLLWSAKAKCPICDKQVVFLREHMKTHEPSASEENSEKAENSAGESRRWVFLKSGFQKKLNIFISKFKKPNQWWGSNLRCLSEAVQEHVSIEETLQKEKACSTKTREWVSISSLQQLSIIF